MRYPCAGEKKVCRTINSEKVTWISASETRSFSVNGPVNSAQTYCGLEIAIIAIMPSSN